MAKYEMNEMESMYRFKVTEAGNYQSFSIWAAVP